MNIKWKNPERLAENRLMQADGMLFAYF